MLNAITILGSSSGRNAGDAALISGIMDPIDEACQSRLLYEIPTIRPAYIRRNYPNRVRPVGMMPWHLSLKMLGWPTYRSIMRSDLSLIFDAILFDRALFNPLFNHLSTLYLMLPFAKARGRKIGMYNVGVGPIDTPLGARMLKTVSDLCDFITVRDKGSLENLQRAGVSNPRIVLTADAAILVKPSAPERALTLIQAAGIDPCGEILALNVSAYLDSWSRPGRKPMSTEHFVSVYSSAVNRVLAQIEVPVLFVATQHHDMNLTRALLARISAPRGAGIVSNIDCNHFDIQAVLGQVALLFGMRLHSLILASSSCTPICGLPHQPKVDYYLRTVGLDEFSLSFDNFSEENLSAHLLRSWEARHFIRGRLAERIPLLKERAAVAPRLVAAMHAGRDLDGYLAEIKPEL